MRPLQMLLRAASLACLVGAGFALGYTAHPSPTLAQLEDRATARRCVDMLHVAIAIAEYSTHRFREVSGMDTLPLPRGFDEDVATYRALTAGGMR